MTDWLDYEKLAANIYRQLHPNAVVKHNDKLWGYKSEAFRQIDVSISPNIAGHNLLIIVQAKNHSRPLDVNAIGEFKSVIEDVRAQKGIIICNSGFTEAALKPIAGTQVLVPRRRAQINNDSRSPSGPKNCDQPIGSQASSCRIYRCVYAS